jgi:hypothetical protein
MKSFFSFCLSLALLISLAACNMPKDSGAEIAPELQTAAAQTVQAILTPLNSPTSVRSETPDSPQAQSTPRLAGTQSATPARGLTPTITPTYSTPTLTFNENTNCRTGPGQDYKIVFTFLAGGTAEVVGAYPQDGYWVVKLPDSGDTCWAWGGYAAPSGSTWVVPSVTPPATRAAAAPEAPAGLNWKYSCGAGGDITVTLEWTDRSDGEEGFRVARDGEVIAQLPPNATSYTDVFVGNFTDKYVYFIEVFGSGLTARSDSVSFSCQG